MFLNCIKFNVPRFDSEVLVCVCGGGGGRVKWYLYSESEVSELSEAFPKV